MSNNNNNTSQNNFETNRKDEFSDQASQVESQFRLFWKTRHSEFIKDPHGCAKLNVPLKEIKAATKGETSQNINLSKEAGQVLSKAAELFIQQNAVKTLIYHAQSKNTQKNSLIPLKDLAFAMSRNQCNDFLSDFFPAEFHRLFEEKEDLTSRPSLNLGRWNVLLKRFDDEFVDLLFPYDEDYYFQTGPTRAYFDVFLTPRDQDFSVQGLFYLGFHKGQITQGTKSGTDQDLVLEFKFKSLIRKGLNDGFSEGIGKATMRNGTASFWLQYNLLKKGKLVYNYLCSSDQNCESWASLGVNFEEDPPFENEKPE